MGVIHRWVSLLSKKAIEISISIAFFINNDRCLYHGEVYLFTELSGNGGVD